MKIKELKEILNQYDDEIEVCTDIKNRKAYKLNKIIYCPSRGILILNSFPTGFVSDTVDIFADFFNGSNV